MPLLGRVSAKSQTSMPGYSMRSIAAGVTLLVLSTNTYAQSTSSSSLDAPVSPIVAPQSHDVSYDNYTIRDGEHFEHLRLHYATLGTPHRNAQGQIDNAVLLLHWTGSSGASLLTPEYVKSLYSPGGPIDAQRYYIVIPDNLGHGQSTKPSDGLHAHFPHYGYGDLVDFQHKLINETLGIHRLHALVGMSMGGMNGWQWAEVYPDELDGVMAVVSLPVTVSGRNLLWRRIVTEGMRSDPDWHGGDYTSQPHSLVEGSRLARMMIEGVPHLQKLLPDLPATDEYLQNIDGQTSKSDANDLLYSLESSSDYNPEPYLAKIKTKFFALNFSDDEFNPDVLQILESRIKLVKTGRYAIQKGTPDSYGHLTMAHPALWSDRVREFMLDLENALATETTDGGR